MPSSQAGCVVGGVLQTVPTSCRNGVEGFLPFGYCATDLDLRHHQSEVTLPVGAFAYDLCLEMKPGPLPIDRGHYAPDGGP